MLFPRVSVFSFDFVRAINMEIFLLTQLVICISSNSFSDEVTLMDGFRNSDKLLIFLYNFKRNSVLLLVYCNLSDAIV